jgi:hypothetical protein
MFDFSSPAFLAELQELRKKQDELARREGRQRRALHDTRSALDEVTGALDSWVATPERMARAVALARGEIVGPVTPPPPQEGVKATLEMFERAIKKARGEI